MRVGLAVMQIENEYGQQDTQIDEDEREQEVFAEQRDDERRGRYELDEKQVEDEQRDENVDAKSDFFTTTTRQIED